MRGKEPIACNSRHVRRSALIPPATLLQGVMVLREEGEEEKGPQRPGLSGVVEKVRFSCSRTRMKVVRLVSSLSARAPT